MERGPRLAKHYPTESSLATSHLLFLNGKLTFELRITETNK